MLKSKRVMLVLSGSPNVRRALACSPKTRQCATAPLPSQAPWSRALWPPLRIRDAQPGRLE